MRECALLVLAGCLVTTEGPVVVSSEPIIAIAANERGLAWAEASPGSAVSLWALERGTLQFKVGAVATLDRIALIRQDIYVSAGPEQEVIGAQGTFLIVRTGDLIQAFDPETTAVDHDPWSRTYPAAGTRTAAVGHGMLALAHPRGWRTFELGGDATAIHEIGAHAPTLVRPIADGIAFATAEGLFTAQHGTIVQVAEAAAWAHLIEFDGVLWAATAPGAGARLIRIEHGASTELDPPEDVIALTVGGGRAYYATARAIYRAH